MSADRKRGRKNLCRRTSVRLGQAANDEIAPGVAGANVLPDLSFGRIRSVVVRLVKAQDFQIGLEPIHNPELGQPGQTHH